MLLCFDRKDEGLESNSWKCAAAALEPIKDHGHAYHNNDDADADVRDPIPT